MSGKTVKLSLHSDDSLLYLRHQAARTAEDVGLWGPCSSAAVVYKWLMAGLHFDDIFLNLSVVAGDFTETVAMCCLIKSKC